MKNIVVLISGRGSNFAAIAEVARKENWAAEGVAIAAVVSNRPDAAGLEKAKAFGIATHVVDHKAFDTREAFEDAHQRAINEGVRIAGCTVHFVSSELDGGSIIGQAVVPVLPSDTADTLAHRVLRLEHILYPRSVKAVAQGRVKIVDGRTITDDETAKTLAVFDGETGSVA